MKENLRLGPLGPRDRERMTRLLRATNVFREEEVEVALELFDDVVGDRGSRASVVEAGDLAVPYPAGDRSSPAAPISSDYVFLGAFTPEDELVGYACYGPTPGTDRSFDLYWIAVDPAYQGAGIGTTLMTEVERRLQGQQARLLVVETSSRSDYTSTRGFYGRRGYSEAARVREFYAPGDDRIILTKRFQHSPPGGERSRHE